MGKQNEAESIGRVQSTKGERSLLSSSAQGATFLILLQVGSRALTFTVNQILLRFLSPELLGISTQLELYLITVLYFARESIRVAVQRQTVQSSEIQDTSHSGSLADRRRAPRRYVSANSPEGRAQTAVNISYISIGLGIPLVFALGYFYLKTASPLVLEVPFLEQSLKLYGVAAFWELLSEPCFVVAQQKLLYKTRAAAETTATLCRCLLTCSIAILSARVDRNLGVLPFALGQLGYAFMLLVVYFGALWNVASSEGFSLSSQPVSSPDGPESTHYLFSYFSRPLLSLSGSLFLQSGVKHLLTQGDALMIAALASLTDQGTYALASNYGGLIARMLFQPIEESSRNLFAKLLTPGSGSKGKPDTENVRAARDILGDIVRLYLLLSIVASAVGPTVAPQLLDIVAGPRWAGSGASEVLSTYCYYIPLLALNGVTESFVSAVASSSELHMQSIWMFAFSVGFAGASYLFLSVLGLGAQGLVWANMVNMLVRIVWSGLFIRRYLQQNQAPLEGRKLVPSGGSIATGVATAALLAKAQQSFSGGLSDLIKSVTIVGPFALTLLYFERVYLLRCYARLRPASPSDSTSKKTQ